MSRHPYLFFTRGTREAMTRYQEILGGELTISLLRAPGRPVEVHEMDPARVARCIECTGGLRQKMKGIRRGKTERRGDEKEE